MQNADWDIFRYVIAVADCGSAVAAAKRLGVNGSTVLRRISKYENERGIRLFDRLQTGYTPTLECEAIIKTAREIGDSIAQVELGIVGQDLRLEGQLSVTTTDTFLETVVAQIINDFSREHPQIEISITVTNERLNLAQRDADVAIRASMKPPEHLLGQRVSAVSFAVYGALSTVAKLPSNPKLKTLKELAWVGTGASNSSSPVTAWMEENIPRSSVKITADTFPAMRSCIEKGGAGVLPCCIGDQSDGLQRLHPPLPELETSMWVLVHPDVRRSAKVAAFSKHVSKGLREKSMLLSGG